MFKTAIEEENSMPLILFGHYRSHEHDPELVHIPRKWVYFRRI
jgi:hypothetical protein